MKRRFPGEQDGSGRAPGRPHDPRFPPQGNGQIQRGGLRAPDFQGRGPPGPNTPGRGTNMLPRGPPPPPLRGNIGRGMPPRHQPVGGRDPFMGRGNPMGRGIGPLPCRHHQKMGRSPDLMGRGSMPGRGRTMGRGPPGPLMPLGAMNVPPPPPRGPLPGGRIHPNSLPPRIPPPPIRPGLPVQQHPSGILPTSHAPPPPFPSQRLSQSALPPNVPLPPAMQPPSHFHPSQIFQKSQAQIGHLQTRPSGPVIASFPTFSTAPAGAATQIHHPANEQGNPLSTYSKEQIDTAWKEYTAPGGIKYYHNSILKESTYTKPDALVVTNETANQPAQKRPWQEYEDVSTGKMYYSDGVTTTWEKPADFQSVVENPSTADDSEPPKKRKKSSQKEVEFGNKEEAVAAFKGLLLAKGIAPTLKWNEVVKFCSSDSRWVACEDVLSVGERRQALAEYQTKRANELRNLERQERIRAKDAFGQLLTDVLPTISGFSAWNSQFAEVRSALAKDDRFHAVADEGTRESLFLDFCEEFRKRDERKKRSKKREAQDAFQSFLSEKEEAGLLTFASTWDSFVSSLDEKDMKDSRFVTSAFMSDSDRQLYFADFVIELQAAEDDKRRRINDARRRAEKAQREAYRVSLEKLATEGRIYPHSRWRSVEELVSADESFSLVHAQDRDAPREIFENFVEEWDSVYRRERSFLSRLLRKEVLVNLGTSYEEFNKILLDEASYAPDVYGDTRRIINREDPVSSARLYFDELVSRASDATKRQAARLRSLEDSSEDEGEIVEDGELPEEVPVTSLNESLDVEIGACDDETRVLPNARLENCVDATNESGKVEILHSDNNGVDSPSMAMGPNMHASTSLEETIHVADGRHD